MGTTVTFQAMPCKGTLGWYVRLIWPSGRSEEIGGFTSEHEAQNWITNGSSVWLRAREIVHNLEQSPESTMRCLACGGEMQVDQIDPHETLVSCEHYTFRCTSCGDIERRLLSRQRVAAAEILESRKIVQPLLKPQEKIFGS